MKKISLLILLVTMYGCNVKSLKVAEDILQGESEVVEKVITDLADTQPTGIKLKVINF